MDEVKVIELKKSVFEANDRDADALRGELKERGVFLLNLMSAPGSGKTTTLIQTINRLKDKIRIAVMEQLHTGGMCHLDAEMTKQGLQALLVESRKTAGAQRQKSADAHRQMTASLKEESQPDLVILENVGNLVCPAEFDTGAVKNAMILSVPEGHDKPLKYPLMFSVCDVVVINKIDVMPYFDFDLEKCKEYIHMRNPKATVIPICAKTGEGVEAFAEWLLKEVSEWKR